MFSPAEFLTDAAMARLTEIRIADPEFAFRVAQARTQRERLVTSGRLNILAADHPARRVTKVGDNPIAMADRRDYLARILRVLSSDSIDGLMATMDIIEEVLTLDGIYQEAGAASLTDGKVLIGSLNRGGLADTCWELDDPITGPSVLSCVAWRLNGAKLLLRIADQESDSLKTMLSCARAITECNAQRLPMFLEPLPVSKTDSGWSVMKDRESLARIAGVVSALGDSSRYLWLKLPYCSGFGVVARSTTLPILLLGGESVGNPAGFLNELTAALGAGSNIRGALVGRNVLYPGDEDPFAVACAVGGLIHHSWSVDQCIDSLASNRNVGLDSLSRYL